MNILIYDPAKQTWGATGVAVPADVAAALQRLNQVSYPTAAAMGRPYAPPTCLCGAPLDASTAQYVGHDYRVEGAGAFFFLAYHTPGHEACRRAGADVLLAERARIKEQRRRAGHATTLCDQCCFCQRVSAGTNLRCARCSFARYCNATCQRAHWAEHKTQCLPVAKK